MPPAASTAARRAERRLVAVESDGARAALAWATAAAFVLLGLPRLLAHELWRDEAWLWLVVREARSPAALFAALGRSGQGYLFPLLCAAARQLSASPRALQLLHLAIATTAAFVFVRWAPLPRPLRLLVVAGYFPFYEYAVISRHYALGMLLLWLACAALAARRPALAGAALGLLCQTTVYGVFLAVAVAAGAWRAAGAERAATGTAATPRVAWPARRLAAGLALAVAGLAAGIWQLVPTPGTSFAPAWLWGWDASRALRVLAIPWRAFVPLPRPVTSFWNGNLLDGAPALQAAGGVLVLALAFALLGRRPGARLAFALGTAGQLAFAYVKLVGEERHHGHLWLLLLAALWIGAPARDGASAPPREATRGWRFATLLALLLVHAAAAVYASVVDLRAPFSNGPATAALLRAEGLDRLPLLGHREPPAASVALPLGKPLWSPSRHVFTTHPDWGPLQHEMSDPALRCEARALAATGGGDVALVINRALPPWDELDPAGARVGAIVPSEDFHLYRLRFARLAATASAAACPTGGSR